MVEKAPLFCYNEPNKIMYGGQNQWENLLL